LLSLKEEVIKEIKKDLEFTGNEKQENHVFNFSRPGYIDPFTRLEQTYKATKDGDQVTMNGT